MQATSVADPPVTPPKRGHCLPVRKSTIQLGVRVAQNDSDLIEHDGIARAVIENTVRAYAQ